jgi:hypothetical protein
MNIKETSLFKKWWVKTIRERNYFGFRYWWFNWLLLLTAILLFIWSSYYDNEDTCNYDFKPKIDAIYNDIDMCCACGVDSIPPPEPVDTIVPPDTIPPKDTIPPPPPKKPPVNAKKCNAKVNSGGEGITKDNVVLGTKSGRVTLTYDMEDIPDKLEVFYEGKKVASTFSISGNDNGYVGGNNGSGRTGTLTFNYRYNVDQHVTVKVSGTNSGTSWSYTLGCPK